MGRFLTQRKQAWLVRLAAVFVGGGTLFSACTTRLRDAVVGGVTEVVLSPQFAAAIVESIVPGEDDDGNGPDGD
jgi:hypothetical protein